MGSKLRTSGKAQVPQWPQIQESSIQKLGHFFYGSASKADHEDKGAQNHH